MPKFKFYADPGHGWLAVKRNLLSDLGITQSISRYSYERGQTVYLEEDCDASKFLQAWKAKHGSEPTIECRHTNNRSPIRSYDSYSGAGTPGVGETCP